MKKLIIIWFVLFIAVIYLFIHGLGRIGDVMDKKIKIRQKELGKEYILNKDTLIIVDYNFYGDTYILSNGAEISGKLVETR